MAVKKQPINWTYRGKEIKCLADCEPGAIGFIYKIYLEDGTGRYYIGRKTMLKPKYTSGVNKGLSKGEYSWRNYQGSSKELLTILKNPQIKYKKEILYFCKTKAEMTYRETSEILCSQALTDPLAFNFWIKAIIYAKHLEPNT